MISENKKTELRKYLGEKDIDFLEDVYKRNETFSEFLHNINEVKWFFPLKVLGLFSPKAIPGPIETKKGMFSIPEWEVLPYLEKISSRENQTFEIITELLEIIENVSNYHINNNEYIKGYDFKSTDNSRTWWFFIKILCNIPNNRVPKNILERLNFWLESPFDTLLQTSEITSNLIPKFLNPNSDANDVEKFQIIFSHLTELRIRKLPEEFSEYFGKKEYEFRLDFYWIKELLEKETFVSLVGEKVSKEFFLNLGMSLRKLLAEDKVTYLLERDGNTIVFDFISDEGRICLTTYKIHGKKVVDVRYAKVRESIADDKKEKIDEKEIGTVNYTNFINVLAKILIENKLFEKDDENLLRTVNDMYAMIFRNETFHSFYEESDLHEYEPIIVLGKLFRETLLIRTNMSDENSLEFSTSKLLELFRENYLYFKKTSLYILAQSKNNFDNVFFESIEKQEVNYVIFENFYFGDELKHYFQKLKAIKFNEVLLLHTLIERGSQVSIFENEDKKEIIWKQRLYQALSHIDFFTSQYGKLKAITGMDYSLSAAILPTSISFGEETQGGRSKYSKDELILLSNEEIVEIINNLQAEQKESSGEYTLGAFLTVLLSIIVEFPQKISENMIPFLKCEDGIIRNILNGLLDAWKNKKTLEWLKIFDFFMNYFDKIDWQTELKKEYEPRFANPRYILDVMTQLIDEGVKDDSWTINIMEVRESFEVFDKLFSISDYLSQGYAENVMEDYLTNSLNTILGRIIMGYVMAIRRSVVLVPEDKKKITTECLAKYDSLLAKNYMEAHAILGSYLNIFDFFDSKWTKNKVEYIEKLRYKETVLWQAFIDGYFWMGRVYLVLYHAMHTNYEMLLELTVRSEHVNKGLINHMCLGYTEGQESLSEKSLFGLLVKNKDKNVLSKVVFQFWILRRGIVLSHYNHEIPEIVAIKEKRNRIIQFFRWLYENFKDIDYSNSSIEEKVLLSDFSKLVTYLYTVDGENNNWLKLIAPFTSENHNAPIFLEGLDNLKTDDIQAARYISEVFLEVLNIDVPRYDPKHIKSILEYLGKFDDDTIKLNLVNIKNKYMGFDKDIFGEL